MSRALSRNFLAQIYSQAVTIAVQLGSVPLLISVWGVEGFGVWALLTAIPAYLAFSDFGFTFIAKNDMAMRVAAGDRAGALETFQSILVLLLIVTVVLFIALSAGVAAMPLDRMFNLGSETLATARDVLLFQIGAALLYQMFLLFSAGVRCEGRAALETCFAASARLAEAGAVVAAALAGGGLAGAAAAALAVRVAVLLALALWLRRTTPWLVIGFGQARQARIRELALPSASYMLVPVSNALLIQAPVIILGAVGTPALVALFAVTRTVARLGMSAANMANYAFVPEYSFAHGRGDRAGFTRLLRLQLRLTLAGAFIYAVAGALLVPFGMSLLTGGEITPDRALALVLVVAVTVEIIWTGLFSPLSALNAHRAVATALLGASAVAILAASQMTGPVWIAGCVAAAHLVVLGVAGVSLARLLKRAGPDRER